MDLEPLLLVGHEHRIDMGYAIWGLPFVIAGVALVRVESGAGLFYTHERSPTRVPDVLNRVIWGLQTLMAFLDLTKKKQRWYCLTQVFLFFFFPLSAAS
jgi:hypothetical protein